MIFFQSASIGGHMVFKVIKKILLAFFGAVLLFITWFYLQYKVIRPECRPVDIFCDLGLALGRDDCLGLGWRSTDSSARPKDAPPEYFICREQRMRLRGRCYLPRFVNVMIEKRYSSQNAIAFYGDVERCPGEVRR